MTTKTTVYKYGHFYDAQTNERVELEDGETYIIVGQSQNFKQAKPAGNNSAIVKTPEHLLDALEHEQKAGKHTKHKRIAKAGDFLFFSITKNKTFTFKVLLLEDLYVKWKNHRANEQKDAVLCDCVCNIEKEINGHIEAKYFEKVYGKSLNELYKSTYVHYWGNYGNPAANAIDRFFKDKLMNENSCLRRECKA